MNFKDERLLEMTSDDLNTILESSEIASTLGGRFVIMKIYPYSFAEYLIANGKEKNYLNTMMLGSKALEIEP